MHESGGPKPVSFGDPFADVFFTLAAIVLLALAAIAPRGEPPNWAQSVSAKLKDSSSLVLTASAEGVERAGVVVPVDRILDDPDLRRTIEEARAARKSVALVVRADGLEAAFQIEPLLGGMEIEQFRVERDASGQGGARR